jgi:hypothetical protein
MNGNPMLPPSTPPDNDPTTNRLDLREREIAAREHEVAAKEAAIAAREEEVSAKQAKIEKSAWINPLVIGLFVATLGLIGNAVVAVLNNRNSQEVERYRVHSNVVVDMIKTNPQYACNNLLFLVKLKFFGEDMDKASAIKQVCEDQPQQAPSLGSDFSNGPVPPIVKNGAPVGADYQWNYTKDGSECVKETIKLSETEWEERTTASSPAECHVNNDTFQYTERESNDPQYFLLYDEGRSLLARLPNVAAGQTGPSAWRLVSNQTWNTARPLTRVK